MRTALSSWTHPLRERLFEWADADRGLVKFGPPEQFWENYSNAVMIEPRLADEVAKREVQKTYTRTALLAISLNGCPNDSLHLHELCFRAACGNPLGFALADAVFYARIDGWQYFAEIVKAIRLEGFLEALAVWTHHFEYGKAFDENINIRRLYRDVLTGNDPDAKFYGKMAIDIFPDMEAYFQAFGKEREAAHDAERNRNKRRSAGSKKRPPSKYKDRVAFGWIPLSFWARRVASIVWILDRESKNAVKSEERILRDIYELGFSDTHRGEHEDGIKASAKANEKKPNRL